MPFKLMLGVIAVVFVLMYIVVDDDMTYEQNCVKAGGKPVELYKSRICLKPEAVIHVE